MNLLSTLKGRISLAKYLKQDTTDIEIILDELKQFKKELYFEINKLGDKPSRESIQGLLKEKLGEKEGYNTRIR